jgi:hypothetical protein
MSPFLNTFFGGGETAATDNFSKFFLNIMKVNYSFYKRCKFHMGF